MAQIATKSRLKIAKHEICAYGLKIISLNNFLAEHNIEDFKIFTGSKLNEALSDYAKTLQELGNKFHSILKERNERFKNHNLTPEEENTFNNSDKCHFCNKEFNENEKKVRDHCHVSGKFRGAAYNSCT